MGAAVEGMLVVTDLDGTLLDAATYGFEPARPALEALRKRGVPLVLCTSKTRAELAPLAARLGLDSPTIVENGGAVVVPAYLLPAPPAWARREGDRVILPLGVERRVLVDALPDVAREAGVTVRSFAQMEVAEIAALTGLGPDAVALAREREYDEPFLVLDAAGRDTELDARLDRAARARGLRVTHGGRLHHLTGPTDKGRAVRTLVELRPAPPGASSVGLGDAANDVPLLRAVDRPIVMPGRGGGFDPVLAAALPHAERAPEPGPAGWARAVLAVLAGETLPTLDTRVAT
jgi:mannosyl-3-phosphoglycerate phosphatase